MRIYNYSQRREILSSVFLGVLLALTLLFIAFALLINSNNNNDYDGNHILVPVLNSPTSSPQSPTPIPSLTPKQLVAVELEPSSTKQVTSTPISTFTPVPTATVTKTMSSTVTSERNSSSELELTLEPTLTSSPSATEIPETPNNTPTSTPFPSPTQSPSPTYAPTSTQPPTPTESPIPTQTSIPTQPPIPTQTSIPTLTPSPTYTPMPTQIPIPTYTPMPIQPPPTQTSLPVLVPTSPTETLVVSIDTPVSPTSKDFVPTSTPTLLSLPTNTSRNATISLLSPRSGSTEKTNDIQVQVQTNGLEEGDYLLFKAGIDSNVLLEEPNLLWNHEESGIYSTNLDFQPGGFGFGKVYFWQVFLFGADGSQLCSSSIYSFKWEDPSLDGGGNGSSTGP